MKGKLHKKENDRWVVRYKMDEDLIATDGGETYLHPSDIQQVELDEIVFNTIENWPEVDFEFVTIHGKVYAKLSVDTPQSNYPELEGTINLCNDIINSREISDKEIKEYAKHNSTNYYEFVKGAKWYREQLKKK